ncbi:ATP-binding cassette domain-containing protein [Streptomyces sp. NPDC090798]|uniref:ATP-binding cassette domain-containing protein n=1 Tax=Streptomyces sp. NPDC090798 TaxID=3365968 RepID=UPI003823D866
MTVTAAGRAPGASPGRGRRPGAVRTAQVPQMEEYDCGAACLAVVLSAHGRHVPLHELREVCGVGRDGVTAAAIVRAAGEYGLRGAGRRVRLQTDAGVDVRPLRELPLPAVAFVNGNHFVVLEGVTRRGKVAVNDPAGGRSTLDPAEFARSFSGIVLTFTTSEEFRTGGRRGGPGRMLGGWLRPHLPLVTFAIVAGLLATALTLAGALVVRAGMLRIAGTGDGDPSGTVTGLLAVALGAGLAVWLQQRALTRILTLVAAHRSRAFLTSLLALPGLFFHRRFAGSLAARAQLADTTAMELTTRLIPVLAGAAGMVPLLTVMSMFSGVLTVLAAAGACLSAFVFRLAARRAAPEEKRLAVGQADRDGGVLAALGMIETLKAEGTASRFFDDWADSHAHELDIRHRLAVSTQRYTAFGTGLDALTGLAVLVCGALLVRQGHLRVADFMGFISLLGAFHATTGLVARSGLDLARLGGSLAKLDDVLRAAPDERYTRDAVYDPTAPKLMGGVELRGVTFGYDPHRAPLISDVTVRIQPGERVAVVGATGSGKSTLARLVIGALDPWQGEVRFDGRPLARISRAELLRSLAYVSQRPLLLEGTVAENVTLHQSAISDARVRAALADACLDDLVDRRGGAHHARVNDGGSNFSGGERQRLALARALSRDPSVLVLDEATSAMESPLEAAVDANLRRRGVTTIVVAHRLSTVRSADRVLVVDGGRVVQQGHHDELVDADGPYRRLVREAA